MRIASRALFAASRRLRLLPLAGTLLSVLLGATVLLPVPADAQQTSVTTDEPTCDARGRTPPMPQMHPMPTHGGRGGHGRPPAPRPLREWLSLTPTQIALLQTAEAAAREAHAQMLELRAKFIREGGDERGVPAANALDGQSVRQRAQRMDQLQDALTRVHRTARDRWFAWFESLDATQRQRLLEAPEAAPWLGGRMPHAPFHGSGHDFH